MFPKTWVTTFEIFKFITGFISTVTKINNISKFHGEKQIVQCQSATNDVSFKGHTTGFQWFQQSFTLGLKGQISCQVLWSESEMEGWWLDKSSELTVMLFDPSYESSCNEQPLLTFKSQYQLYQFSRLIFIHFFSELVRRIW